MNRPFTLDIQVPARIQELLLSGGSAHASTTSALRDFSAWLSDNKTPLFFDYTDHGIAHVTNVLRSVENLIPDDAWSALSSYDAEAIIAAVLLHDCAMHLSIDGFRALLTDTGPVSAIYGSEPAWADEYRRFEQEAVRWDSSRLISVFGDAEPVQQIGHEGDLSDRQKLLVGEFLRRNHARLAHEIALSGVPGPSGGVAKFDPFSGLAEKKRDLYGYLARSHNMSIRQAVDRLPRISRRQYLEVHCPYIMALLRVADYIQIDAARAPTQILQLRGLKSPVSRNEWAKHQAVLELHQQGEDPEALNVIACPDSVTIFVGLRTLFRDLQRELDASWATLGEVYGRFDELSVLGLRVRRLVSNLDDAKAFEAESRPGYLPAEIRLTTSSAELLHLLVGPLYGNKPSIGMRELVQNAVDACLEMEHQALLKGVEHLSLIEVEIDNAMHGKGGVRITDNGVGMTIDTLRDYFLKAGASFRRSAWWSSHYATEENKALVRRSGRFGVGGLAAFLVGPRMTVTTRSYTDTSGYGYKFSLSADDDLIDIKRIECDFGTSIEIPVRDKEVLEGLLRHDSDYADWYIYDSPRVIYRERRGGEWEERSPRWKVASEDSEGWVKFVAADFSRVQWRSPRTGHYSNLDDGRLACNGIFVAEDSWGRSLPSVNISPSGGAYDVVHPDLLVDDKDGRLPLNVQRDGLVDSGYPFQKELEDSIANEYAMKLAASIDVAASPANFRACASQVSLIRRQFSNSRDVAIGLTDLGWVPAEVEVFKSLGLNRFVLDYCESSALAGLISKLRPGELPGWTLMPLNVSSAGTGTFVGRLRGLIDNHSDSENHVPYQVGAVEGIRIFAEDSLVAAAKKKGGVPNYLFRSLTLYGQFNGWTVFDFGDTSGLDSDCDWSERCESLTAKMGSGSKLFAFVAYGELAASVKSAFLQAWLKVVPDLALRPVGDAPSDLDEHPDGCALVDQEETVER